MNMWWSTMATFERIYWIISVIATVFLVIRAGSRVFISGLDFHLHLGSDLGAHGGAGGGHEGDFGVSHFTLLTLGTSGVFRPVRLERDCILPRTYPYPGPYCCRSCADFS